MNKPYVSTNVMLTQGNQITVFRHKKKLSPLTYSTYYFAKAHFLFAHIQHQSFIYIGYHSDRLVKILHLDRLKTY